MSGRAEEKGTGIFDHLAQLDKVVPLGDNAVPQGSGHIAAVHPLFLHLKDDLAHTHSAIQPAPCGKLTPFAELVRRQNLPA
jgi:hypothetical protein